jgi:hypothetical protein
MKYSENFLRLYSANKNSGMPKPKFKQIDILENERNNALPIFKSLYRNAEGDYRIIGYSLHIKNINVSGFISV